MGKNRILRDLREMHHEMVDDYGKFYDRPSMTLKDRQFSAEQIKLIRYVLTLVMTTTIVSEETKLYVKYSSDSVKKIFDRVRKTKRYDPNNDLTLSALNSKIYRDQVRLEDLFGNDLWDDIKNNNGNLSKYFLIISRTFAKMSGGSDVRDMIALDIPEDNLATVCDREKLDELIEIVRPYLRSQMETIVDALDPVAVGYFNFLLNSPAEMLPIEQRKDRNHLIYSLTGEVPDEAVDSSESSTTRIVGLGDSVEDKPQENVNNSERVYSEPKIGGITRVKDDSTNKSESRSRKQVPKVIENNSVDMKSALDIEEETVEDTGFDDGFGVSDDDIFGDKDGSDLGSNNVAHGAVDLNRFDLNPNR